MCSGWQVRNEWAHRRPSHPQCNIINMTLAGQIKSPHFLHPPQFSYIISTVTTEVPPLRSPTPSLSPTPLSSINSSHHISCIIFVAELPVYYVVSPQITSSLFHVSTPLSLMLYPHFTSLFGLRIESNVFHALGSGEGGRGTLGWAENLFSSET